MSSSVARVSPALRHVQIDRSQPRVHPPDPFPREVGRAALGVLPLFCPNLRFSFDLHHLSGHPFQHRQHRIGFRDEPQ